MISSVGFQNLLWFIGRVEAIGSGNGNAGQVKVRAYGVHPPLEPGQKSEGDFGYNSIEGVETEQLPWAPVLNATGGAVSLMPPIGEMVVGFFLDGREAQYPVVVGTLPGVMLSLPSQSGYSQYEDSYVQVSDSSVENFGTYTGGISPQNASMPSKIEAEMIAQPDREAKTADDRVMPKFAPVSGGSPDSNAVLRAKPEGANIQVGGYGKLEHIAMQHPDGSFIQIDDHGNIGTSTNETIQEWAKNIVQHADGSFDIIAGDKCSIHVMGGDAIIKVAGNVNIVSENDMNFTASGEINLNAGEAVNIKGAKVSMQSSADNIDIAATGKLKLESNGKFSIKGEDVNVKGDGVNIDADSNLNLRAGGSARLGGASTSIKGTPILTDPIIEGGASAPSGADVDNATVPSESRMPAPSGRKPLNPIQVSGSPSASNRSHNDDADYSDKLEESDFSGEGIQKGIEIACRLREMGYSPEAAAALAGNAMYESAGFTADTEFGNGIGRGWLQWSFERREKFEAYAAQNGLDPKSDAANFGFMMYELEGRAGNNWSGGGSTNEFKQISNVEDASKYFMDKYLRPKASSANLRQRTANAKQILAAGCPDKNSVEV